LKIHPTPDKYELYLSKVRTTSRFDRGRNFVESAFLYLNERGKIMEDKIFLLRKTSYKVNSLDEYVRIYEEILSIVSIEHEQQ